jgi:hypothetical protein
MSKHPGVCGINSFAKKKTKNKKTKTKKPQPNKTHTHTHTHTHPDTKQQNRTNTEICQLCKKHVLSKHLSSLDHQNERQKKLAAAWKQVFLVRGTGPANGCTNKQGDNIAQLLQNGCSLS